MIHEKQMYPQLSTVKNKCYHKMMIQFLLPQLKIIVEEVRFSQMAPFVFIPTSMELLKAYEARNSAAFMQHSY